VSPVVHGDAVAALTEVLAVGVPAGRVAAVVPGGVLVAGGGTGVGVASARGVLVAGGGLLLPPVTALKSSTSRLPNTRMLTRTSTPTRNAVRGDFMARL
jgi:hypothetical protein